MVPFSFPRPRRVVLMVLVLLPAALWSPGPLSAAAEAVAEAATRPDTVSLDPASGPAGTRVTVTGCLEYYKQGERLDIQWPGGRSLGRATVRADGCYRGEMEVPGDAEPGGYEVSVHPGGATAEFVVEGSPAWDAELELTPSSVVAGGVVAATGCGWPEGPVDVVWAATGSRLETTEGGGCLDVEVPIPAAATPGEYRVVAENVGAGVRAEVTVRVAAPSGAAPTATFTWDRPERLRAADERGLADEIRTAADLSARTFPVELDACGSSSPGGGAEFSWEFVPTGRYVAVSSESEWRQERTVTSCETTWEAPGEGDWRVTLRVRSPSGEVATAMDTVRVRDLFVVSLGDSYSSGEGNPDAFGEYWQGDLGAWDEPAKWTDYRCHRSRHGWPYKVARMLEKDYPEPTAVSYVGLSCSGAKLEGGGILDSYEGALVPGEDYGCITTNEMNTCTGDIPPQIDQLAEHIAVAGRVPDFVLLSIGGNDIGFADIVTDCLLASCGVVEQHGLERDVQRQLRALERRYGRLAERLESLGIPPHRVHILEYPDPTRDGYGEFDSCYWITENSEFEWAYNEVLLPLNRLIRRMATVEDGHGWTYLGGMMQTTRNHGICAGEDWLDEDHHTAWFRDIEDSFDYQDDELGAFHPNRPGHRALARTAYGQLDHSPFKPVLGDLTVETTYADGGRGWLLSNSTYEDHVTLDFVTESDRLEIEATLNGAPYSSGTAIRPVDDFTSYRLVVRPRLPALADSLPDLELPEQVYRFAVAKDLGRGALLDRVDLDISYQNRRWEADQLPSLGSVRRGETSRPAELGVYLTEVAVHAETTDPDIRVALALEERDWAWMPVDDPDVTPLGSGEVIRSGPGGDGAAQYYMLVVTAEAGSETEQVRLPIAVANDPVPVRQAVDLTRRFRGSRGLWYAYDPDRGGWMVDEFSNPPTSSFAGPVTPLIDYNSRLARDVYLEVDGLPHDVGSPVSEVGPHTLQLYVCMNILADCQAPSGTGFEPHRVTASRDGPITFTVYPPDPWEAELEARVASLESGEAPVPPRPEGCGVGCLYDAEDQRWKDVSSRLGACPEVHVPEDGFTDLPPEHPHEAAVDCAIWWGVVPGAGATRYGPAQPVSREEAAALLVRLLVTANVMLPQAPADAFPDDRSSPYHDRINELAALGVLAGDDVRFRPSQPVTRAELAELLVRSYAGLIGRRLDPVDGTALERAVAGRLMVSDPAVGSAPERPVRRGEVAESLVRLLDAAVRAGLMPLPPA